MTGFEPGLISQTVGRIGIWRLFLVSIALLCAPILGWISVSFEGGLFIALAPIIGAVFLIVIFSSPFAGFQILLLASLTVWLSSIQIVAGLSIVPLMGIVVVVSWLVGCTRGSSSIVRVSEYTIIVLFAVVGLISALGSGNIGASLSSLFTYLQLFMFLVLSINLASTPSRLQQIGWMIILSSFVLAATILLDSQGLLPSGIVNSMIGGVSVDGGSIVAVTRAGGAWGDPNYSALQISVALPFVIHYIPLVRHWLLRIMLVAVICVLVTAVFLTYSTGGAIGLFVLFIMLALPKRFHSIKKHLSIVAALFLVVLSLVLISPPEYVQRITDKTSQVWQAIIMPDQADMLSLGTGRVSTWLSAVQAYSEAPLVGVGPGLGPEHVVEYNLFFLNQGRLKDQLAAHNMFLAVAVEFGALGFILFVLILFFALRKVWPWGDWRPSESGNAQAVLLGTRDALFMAMIVFIVQGLALDAQTLKVLWVLIGMCIAFDKLKKSNVAWNRPISDSSSSSPPLLK